MGYQITEPSAGSTDWTNVSTIMNFAMKGFMGLSLTNYDSTDVPFIAAGSRVEVAGAMYYFASSEAITGSLSTNQNYVMLTTSSSSISVSYTTDAPEWVPSKNGWYDSSTGVQRYAGGLSTDSDGKWIYYNRDIRVANMSSNSVDSDQYVDGSIDTIHLANSAVGANKLATGASFASVVTRYYSIPAIFASPGTGEGDEATLNSIDGWIPVHLPNGAIVTEFRRYDGAGTNTTYFARGDLADADVTALSTLTPAGADFEAISATIDNTIYKYYIRTVGSAGCVMYGYRITYTIVVPLP